MEESEKRRERLRAMRVEATTDVVSSSSQQTLISTPLSNPMLENQNSNTPSTAQRFDFYTDPMAAYVSNKQRPFTPRPHVSPSQCGPRNPGMPPSSNQPHQFQNNNGPHQGMYQGGDPYYSPGPTSIPMGVRSPYPMHHQGSRNFNSAYPSPGSDYGRGNLLNNNPSPGPGYAGGPSPVYQGRPDFRPPFPPQGRGQQSNNSPSPVAGHGGVSQGRGQWSNNSPGPGPGPGYGGCPQGRGQWSNNSPNSGPVYGGGSQGRGQWRNNSPDSGPGPGYGGCPQGRGQWSNNSPGSGHGGGSSPHAAWGRGQQDGNGMSYSPRYTGGRGRGRGRGRQKSNQFYNKSMVEDPWKSLTPVIWKGPKENDVRSSTSNQGSFQKNPSSKKPRVSNPDDSNSKKGGSLADYLAEAFDE